MAGERENLTENSEKPDNNISGLLRLNTESGPVVLDIQVANLISGSEESVSRLIENPEIDVKTRFQEARGRLDGYIESCELAAPNGRFLLDWKIRCDTDYKLYGDDALVTLFPRDTDRDISYVERLLKVLHSKRGNYGSRYVPDSINTKSQLVDTPDGLLLQLNTFGPKMLELTSLMKVVILAERRLEDEE